MSLSKRAANRKRDNQKAFRAGQLKARERFINKKFALMEELVGNEKKKEQLLAKDLKELNPVEKAAVFSLSMKPVDTEEFTAKKEERIKAEIVSAKHKFGVK
jgi:nitrogen fixation protein FixH